MPKQTKAELIRFHAEEVAAYESLINTIQLVHSDEITDYQKAMENLAGEVTRLQAQIWDSESKSFPFNFWYARAEPGRPICLGSASTGLCIQLYANEDEELVGVVITDDVDVVAAAGMLPAEVLMAELAEAAQ